MNTSTKVVSQRREPIGTRIFFRLLGLFLFVMFGIGLIAKMSLSSDPPNVLLDLVAFFVPFVVKGALVAAITSGLLFMLVRIALDQPLSIIISTFESTNRSYVLLCLSMLATSTFIVLGAQGANIGDFLFALLGKGAVCLATSTFVTAYVAYRSDIRSLPEFAKWVDDPFTNNHTYFIAGIFACVSFFGMFVR